MTSELQSSEGCEIPASEFLNMARIGLEPGPEASAEEFTEALKEVPDEGRAPVVSDRGLILVALSQEEANETARILHDKFIELTSSDPRRGTSHAQ